MREIKFEFVESNDDNDNFTVIPKMKKLDTGIGYYLSRTILHSPFPSLNRLLCLNSSKILQNRCENGNHPIIHGLLTLNKDELYCIC